MDEMKTPTLDRVNALREKLDICGEFLGFILEKFDVFNPELKREEPFYIGSGDYINKKKVLAEFFNIDLNEVEEERELLIEMVLEKIRKFWIKKKAVNRMIKMRDKQRGR